MTARNIYEGILAHTRELKLQVEKANGFAQIMFHNRVGRGLLEILQRAWREHGSCLKFSGRATLARKTHRVAAESEASTSCRICASLQCGIMHTVTRQLVGSEVFHVFQATVLPALCMLGKTFICQYGKGGLISSYHARPRLLYYSARPDPSHVCRLGIGSTAHPVWNCCLFKASSLPAACLFDSQLKSVVGNHAVATSVPCMLQLCAVVQLALDMSVVVSRPVRHRSSLSFEQAC